MKLECSLCKEEYHSNDCGMCDCCISIISQENDMHKTIENLQKRILLLEEKLLISKKRLGVD
jgi:translation elongation factor EF-Ts